MIIRKHVSIDSAHKLNMPYESKCKNLHGHRWEIDVEIEGKVNGNDMVIDYILIKNYFDAYDHVFLNDLVDFETTAENLARFFADGVQKISNAERVKILLRETPTSEAEYEVRR